jgi:hypothetical protein
MTEDGAAVLPGPEAATVTVRPRTAYVGFRAFGGGDGAVLLAPGVVRRLRTAAEFATDEGRIAGGLLYGRYWADDQGSYLVVTGFLEAGPGENPGRREPGDDFTLSQADLRLLREDAARMYSASVEVGWWRTLEQLGEFGPGDFLTQQDLAGRDGVGLLVYGSGPHWGTAYLGPDGDAPDSAGTLVATGGRPAVETAPRPGADFSAGGSTTVATGSQPRAPFAIASLAQAPRPAAGTVRLDAQPLETGPLDTEALGTEPLDTEPPESEPLETALLDTGPLGTGARETGPPEPGSPGTGGTQPEPAGTGPSAATAPSAGTGTAVATRRRAALTPAPQPAGPRVMSPVRVPTDEWRARRPSPGYVGPETPTDVKIVVGGLIIAFIIVAVIIGMLVSNALIAVIAGVVFMLVILGFVWMSRL